MEFKLIISPLPDLDKVIKENAYPNGTSVFLASTKVTRIRLLVGGR